VNHPSTPRCATCSAARCGRTGCEQTPKIEAEAENIVERLVNRGTFDAATELAERLPSTCR
jgi:hypothetical protein